jgi:replication initiation protein RepC
MQADEDHKRLREHIQDLFRQIRELENGEANDAATSILPRRRPGELNDIKEMQLVADALAAVLADFSTKVSQPEMTDGSDENVRLITKKEKKRKLKLVRHRRRVVANSLIPALLTHDSWPLQSCAGTSTCMH